MPVGHMLPSLPTMMRVALTVYCQPSNRQSTEYEIYYCTFLSIKKMWMDCAWLLAYYFISNQVNMRSKTVLKAHLGDITIVYVSPAITNSNRRM